MQRNTELLNKVADAIEGRTVPGMGFYMPAYFTSDLSVGGRSFLAAKDHTCQTTGCIAGWTATIGLEQSPIHLATMYDCDIYDYARNALGLTEDEADHLFVDNMRATDIEAVKHLRQIANGGPVNWHTINPDYAAPHEWDVPADEDQGENEGVSEFAEI